MSKYHNSRKVREKNEDLIRRAKTNTTQNNYEKINNMQRVYDALKEIAETNKSLPMMLWEAYELGRKEKV